MSDTVNECDRVMSAIADGRFLEDPPHWRAHIDRCPTCSKRVSGLFELRRSLDAAAQSSGVADDDETGDVERVRGAITRFERQRTRSIATLCVVMTLVAGGAAFWWHGRARDTDASTSDPVAYAKRLHDVVYGDPSKPDYDRLKKDTSLQAEFVAALGSKSSLVRRTALDALMSSAVDVDPEVVEKALTDWREDLERPIEVAAAGDSGGAIYEAMARRRTSTVFHALSGTMVIAANKKRHVDPARIVPFVTDTAPEVRQAALLALTYAEDFVPGDEVRSAFSSDAQVEVRMSAADCLAKRLGPAGVAWMRERLREKPDDALEPRIVPTLDKEPGGLDFARARLTSDSTGLRARLGHARTLLRANALEMPAGLFEKAVASGDAEVLFDAAFLAAKGDWTQHRDALQSAWRRLDLASPLNSSVAAELAEWDIASRDASRLRLALEICEKVHASMLRKALEALASSDDASIRDRAKALLRDAPR